MPFGASAISQATSGSDCWGQGFTIDGLANLYGISSLQCSSGTLGGVTVDSSTNRLTTSGYVYDSAGNMTAEGSSYSYSFDAENRMTTASGGGVSGGPYTYLYDGNSLRVKKSNSSAGTLYWRSLSGDALTETDLSGNSAVDYVFFGGRRIARIDSSANVFYYYADHLGTTRSMTNSSGVTCYDSDFTPNGQELNHTNTCPQNYKFTAYERDSETGLDYAFARYYNPRLGRFMSADPLPGDISAPQSLNRYAYVLNNPINFIDPFGLVCTLPGTPFTVPCPDTTSTTVNGYGGSGGSKNLPGGAGGYLIEQPPFMAYIGGIKQGIRNWVSGIPRQLANAACSAIPDAVSNGVGGDAGMFITGGGQVGVIANGRTGEMSVYFTGTVSTGVISYDSYISAGAAMNVPSNSALSGNSTGYAAGIERYGASFSGDSFQATVGPGLSPLTAAKQVSNTSVSPSVPYVGYALNLPRAACKLVTGN